MSIRNIYHSSECEKALLNALFLRSLMFSTDENLSIDGKEWLNRNTHNIISLCMHVPFWNLKSHAFTAAHNSPWVYFFFLVFSSFFGYIFHRYIVSVFKSPFMECICISHKICLDYRTPDILITNPVGMWFQYGYVGPSNFECIEIYLVFQEYSFFGK